MTTLVERAAEQLDRLVPADSTVLLAVSGGPDSLAMLDLLAHGAALHGRRLTVGHVDHGIHPGSAEVGRMVAAHAAQRSLPFVTRQVELGPDASETSARRARRRALRALARDVGATCIALAHHREDQAETVLLRVLAGTGPVGLAGMAARRGPWVRPLLWCPRAELHRHLTEQNVSPWQDPANLDPRHLRSWLRIAALPLLQQRTPELVENLIAVAEQAAGDRAAWNQVPELLEALDLQRQGGAISVAAAPLQGYRSVVQDAVISALGRRFGVPLGSARRAAVRRLIAGGRSGARVSLGAALEAELTFDRLILRRPVQAIAGVALPQGGTVRLGSRRFTVARVQASGKPERLGNRVQVTPGDYLLRSWRAGDRIRPLHGTGTRAVAELFKEARVATGERKGWPVLVSAEDDATVVWVPGICRSDAHVPMTGKDALDVECDLA